MRTALAIAICLVVSASICAQPAVVSSGPELSFSIVRRTIPEKGYAILTGHVKYIETFKVVEKRTVDGVVVEVVRDVQRQLARPVDITYDLANSRVISTDGKQLPIDEVWKRLTPNTIVAISGDFSAPSALFLRALSADTLVIIPSLPKAIPAPKE